MNLKKYLLAGSLASILVLGACGDTDEESGESPQDTGGTEESSEVEDE